MNMFSRWLWETFFGNTTLLNLDAGFWVSMSVVAIIVIVMNVVFWSMSPHHKVDR